MQQTSNLHSLSKKFSQWLQQDVVPLWATVGIEHTTGGSFERLNSQGKPDLSCDRRVRVNYRQMFVFSLADQLGWINTGNSIVKNLHQYVNQYGKNSHPTNSFAHLLNAKNIIIDSKQDTYDLAFYLLACAYRYEVFNDTSALTEANETINNLDHHIKGLKSGWLEGDYVSHHRRQNPHMHLFEAFIALYDASKQPKWLARAGEVFSMFESHFYDANNGVLLEYFNADWSPQFGTKGKVVEPGHMFEWVWLLNEYSKRTDVPVSNYTDTLYNNAFNWGVDVTGLVYDEVNEVGDPIKTTKRCWPITELIKASIAQAENTNNHALKVVYENNAANGIQCLFDYYVNPKVKGSYYDQLDSNNQVISEYAPASTLYHLMVAANEVMKYCHAKNVETQACEEQ